MLGVWLLLSQFMLSVEWCMLQEKVNAVYQQVHSKFLVLARENRSLKDLLARRVRFAFALNSLSIQDKFGTSLGILLLS